MRAALQLAASARQRGNHPFGALLVIGEHQILSAENSVTTDSNPTCHAETNLVQKAIKELSKDQLAGSTLYTSCEPCAMCAGAIYWSGIRKIVFGLSCQDLAKVTGGSFVIPCRDLFTRARHRMEVTGPCLMEEALAVHQGFWNQH
jgi:tRNA(Arg) A34 adenosine deaminase TadA